MEYLENDRFAIAGFLHAQGKPIDRRDWPTDDLELAYFNAGIYQSHVVNGTTKTALHCVTNRLRDGAAPTVDLHPANWR